MKQAPSDPDPDHSCVIVALLTEGMASEMHVDFRKGDTAATDKQVHF